MIRRVARRLNPVGKQERGAAVYDRFEREPDTLAIAVVDETGKPIGLIERNSFFLKMAADYGRALFAGRPISAVMDCEPIIVEGDTTLESFLARAVQTSAAELLRGFIVVEQGRYLGVGTALDLLMGAFHENVRRAADMSDLADQRLLANQEAERALIALGAARDAAEAANRAKSEFLATMSHEIRTPLNGVLGVASALGRTQLNARQREMVRLIEDSAGTLQVLLSDVLDLARVEAGRLDITAEAFDLSQTVLAAAELFRSKAEEKGLDLYVHIAKEARGRFVGDAVRLKQILGNLLSNAVKFTESGQVRLSVAAPERDGERTLTFVIADTGIGFDATVKARLFARFSQADGSITRRFGGSGLGLSISGALAELMGGTIEAESTPGEGSTFVLTLPFPVAPAETTQSQAAAGSSEIDHGRALRILAAEDHPVNRKVLELIFNDMPVDLAMAEDGEEALERFIAGRFDVVLMDMQMPKMGGLDATIAIRAHEARHGLAHTPVIMLTANALPEHEVAGRAAGADAFLTKPIAAAHLFAAIEAALAAGPKAAAQKVA
jgi:signal transduction histidine kinase/AmiR/NasT family two-component response regulator